MTSSHVCARTGCTTEAAGVLGFALYPLKQVMRYYRTDKPLTRVILMMNVCPEHAKECKFKEMLGPLWREVVKAAQASGTVVDVPATKPIVVPFDDPEYVRLLLEQLEGRAP